MNDWTLVIEIGVLALLLAVGTFLKRTVKFFQKYLIPNAMIAGFIGMILGEGWLNILPLKSQDLEWIIYHLMAVGFIALALKGKGKGGNRDVTNTGALIVATYLVQALVGFALTLLLVYTVLPDLFPTFGLLLPLGFGQGPGQAYAIGKQWEELGFASGANIGLSIAAIGYLWAYIGGIILANFLVKRRKASAQSKTIPKIKHLEYEADQPGEVSLGESIDKFTIQITIISVIYLITYLTIKGASNFLLGYGSFGATLSQLLWGFHFIIGAIYAILARVILGFLRKRKIMKEDYLNNYLLQRISGGSFDFMIVASIAVISVSVLKAYLVPTLLITAIGGLATVVYLVYTCKKVYNSYVLEHTLALYAMLTGTISSGMALLREVDPEFNSPTAEYLVLGSGVGLVFGFPLMILLNVPVMGVVQNNPLMYLYSYLGFTVYFIFLTFFMWKNSKVKIGSSEVLDYAQEEQGRLSS